MGFFSSYSDYLLLVYLVYFYLIGKKILGQPTTCKTGQRTCSPWEPGMTYCCHSRVQHRRAFCPDVLHKSGHRNSSSVSGMEADYSFMRKLCWAQEWWLHHKICPRQTSGLSSERFWEMQRLPQFSNSGSRGWLHWLFRLWILFPALFFFLNTSPSPWTWLHLSPS